VSYVGLPAGRKFKPETNMDFMPSPYYFVSVTKYEERKWICYKEPVEYTVDFFSVDLLPLVMM
jgi:hypothetical protein